MTVEFYRAFADQFRGSRDQIKARLHFYQPLLDLITSSTERPRALDLGCGRGEWLELLRESGFNAKGVDLDTHLLSDCQELGLDTENRDATEILRSSPDNSLNLVSAFHLVEHLTFDQVLELIKESYRVLVPGGVLLMETPNSENLGVGTWNFYLDPTPQRPIPHPLLEFAAKYGGFEHTGVVRTNEDPSVNRQPEVSLFDVLCKSSPDCAVVGMKAGKGQSQSVNLLNKFLTDAKGLTLQSIANRFDDKYSGAIRALDADVFMLKAQFENFQAVEAKLLKQFGASQSSDTALSLEQFMKSRETITDRLDQLERDCNARIDALAGELALSKREQDRLLHEQRGLLQQLQDVHNSTSWRITRPIRSALTLFQKWRGKS